MRCQNISAHPSSAIACRHRTIFRSCRYCFVQPMRSEEAIFWRSRLTARTQTIAYPRRLVLCQCSACLHQLKQSSRQRRQKCAVMQSNKMSSYRLENVRGIDALCHGVGPDASGAVCLDHRPALAVRSQPFDASLLRWVRCARCYHEIGPVLFPREHPRPRLLRSSDALDCRQEVRLIVTSIVRSSDQRYTLKKSSGMTFGVL